MITVDEAILLADRVVGMTNGPYAAIGRIAELKLRWSRSRKALLDHPDSCAYREEILGFLEEYKFGSHLKKKDAP